MANATVAEIRAALSTLNRPPTMHDLYCAAIDNALERHGSNRTYAARELGISLRTLQRYVSSGAAPRLRKVK